MELDGTSAHLLNERLISLPAAGRRFPPRRGKGPHPTPSAVWRWVRSGVRGPDGRRIYLDAILLCGRWLTSIECLRDSPSLNSLSTRPSLNLPQSKNLDH